MPQAALDLTELTSQDVGRSFALIVSVDTYHNLPMEDQRLKAAARDRINLAFYLKEHEFFDEIVVLSNETASRENLEYFLQVYFPERLEAYPRSRFLLAYSGHGFQQRDRCYLLQADAESFADKANAISAEVLVALYGETAGPSFRSLAVINGCQSEALHRKVLADQPLQLKKSGHHLITAGGSRDATWHVDHVGPGSRLFEKLFAGLGESADRYPRRVEGTSGDGLVDVQELEAYLRQHVHFDSNPTQNPRASDLSRSDNADTGGGFFFLQRQRQVEAGVVEDYSKGRSLAVRFGQPLPFEATPELVRLWQTEVAEDRWACDQGIPRSCRKLGYNYENGQGVSKDLERAAKLYRQACDLGHARGCTALGRVYFLGLGVDKDLAQYAAFSLQGCDGGDARGCTNLGVDHSNGEGVVKDNKRAADLFLQGCNGGNAHGCNNLARHYSRGSGVKKDFIQAAEFFRRGCDGGGVEGCRRLGLMYQKGQGVEQDSVRASSLLRESCQEDSGACNDLGNQYWNGDGVAKNLAQALRLFQLACDGGNPVGCSNIGFVYESGTGVQKDLVRAIQIYREVCDGGEATGCRRYEKLRGRSEDVSKDSLGTWNAHRQACDAGDAEGCASLGLMYQLGEGVERDYARARTLFKQACEGGQSWTCRPQSLVVKHRPR